MNRYDGPAADPGDRYFVTAERAPWDDDDRRLIVARTNDAGQALELLEMTPLSHDAAVNTVTDHANGQKLVALRHAPQTQFDPTVRGPMETVIYDKEFSDASGRPMNRDQDPATFKPQDWKPEAPARDPKLDAYITRRLQDLDLDRRRAAMEKPQYTVENRDRDQATLRSETIRHHYQSDQERIERAGKTLTEAREKQNSFFGGVFGGSSAEKVAKAERELGAAHKSLESKLAQDPHYQSERQAIDRRFEQEQQRVTSWRQNAEARYQAMDGFAKANWGYGSDAALDALKNADQLRAIDKDQHLASVRDTGFLKSEFAPFLQERHVTQERQRAEAFAQGREQARDFGEATRAADWRFAERLHAIDDKLPPDERHRQALEAKIQYHNDRIDAIGKHAPEADREKLLAKENQGIEMTRGQRAELAADPEAFKDPQRLNESRVRAGFDGYQREELGKSDDRYGQHKAIREHHQLQASAAPTYSEPGFGMGGSSGQGRAAPREPDAKPDMENYLPGGQARTQAMENQGRKNAFEI